MIRRTLTWFLIGALIGIFLTMWLGPSFVRWWWLPPGPGGALFTSEQVASAAGWVVKIQALLAIVLGVLFAVLANLIGRKRRPATTPTPTPPSGVRTPA